MGKRLLYLTVVSLVYSVCRVECGCYFPLEVQGEFMTQSLTSREIAYTSISILYNSVTGWGRCHTRRGHQVVLEDEKEPGGGPACFRCIRMEARSKNVIQLHVRNGRQCLSTPGEALETCPNAQDVVRRSSTEMMLYKTRSFYGDSAVSKLHCPINGHYVFTYNNTEARATVGEKEPACPNLTSKAGDCPTGYKFDLQFRGCLFPDFDMSFQCLGHWQGEDGQKYLSLLDTKLPQLGEEPRPRYRCAIYKTDPVTRVTHLALSSDSTCVNKLSSHNSGYETLHLHPQWDEKEEDKAVLEQSCTFPGWSQGHWDTAVSIEGGKLIYRESQEFTTHHGRCVTSPAKDRYLVRLRSACGDSSHACLALEKRADNILELRLGTRRAETADKSLCDDTYMTGAAWVTQARTSGGVPFACPLEGEYTGRLPDAEGLCARSVTSCEEPDRMQYQVYNCNNVTEVYEDRSYQCYGQFEEDGLVYTFTRRLDLPRHECFVGVTLDSVQRIVTEAGVNCQRGKEPLNYGMLLARQSSGGDWCSDSTSDNLNDVGDSATSTSRPVSPRLTTAALATARPSEAPGRLPSEDEDGRYPKRPAGKHNHKHRHANNRHNTGDQAQTADSSHVQRLSTLNVLAVISLTVLSRNLWDLL